LLEYFSNESFYISSLPWGLFGWGWDLDPGKCPLHYARFFWILMWISVFLPSCCLDLEIFIAVDRVFIWFLFINLGSKFNFEFNLSSPLYPVLQPYMICQYDLQVEKNMVSGFKIWDIKTKKKHIFLISIVMNN